MTEPARLVVRVDAGPGADPAELAEQASALRAELLDLDVRSVEPLPGGPPPAGAKGAEGFAIGTLLVTLAKSSGLPAVISAITSWVGSVHQRSVKLEIDGDSIEVTGISSADQRRLIDDWLHRHGE
jgi:hypothetical protein